MSRSSNPKDAAFPVSLTRKLLTSGGASNSGSSSSFKANEDAIKLSSELLRLFVIEAVRRAAIESETSVSAANDDDDDDDDDAGGGGETPKKKRKVVTVLPKHVSAIAADLIMDFS